MSSELDVQLDDVTNSNQLDALHEKLDNYRRIIDKQQEEIHLNSVSQVGVQLLTQLLQEARKDVNSEQKKVRHLKAAVNELQRRLVEHDLSADFYSDDGNIPAPSQAVVDSLIKENLRLRRLVDKANGDPDELIKLKELCNERRDDNNKLRSENKELMKHIQYLESALSAKGDDKDEEIARLQQKITKLKHENHTKDIICEALAEKQKDLKLAQSDLGSHQENVQPKYTQTPSPPDGNELVDLRAELQSLRQVKEQLMSEKAENELVDSLRAELQSLRQVNEQLMRENAEVKEMNSQWQLHEQQRRDYIQSLQSNIALVNKEKEEDRKKLSEVMAHKMQLEMELAEQRREYEALNATTESYRADINALEQQIQYCTEDFVAERKEKEKAKKDLENLRGNTPRRQINALTSYQRFQIDAGPQSPPLAQSQPASNVVGAMNTPNLLSAPTTTDSARISVDDVDVGTERPSSLNRN